MSSSILLRPRSVVFAALAILAGCSGALQPSFESPVAKPAAPNAKPGGAHSWINPPASSGDLLYVSSPGNDEVYVFTYPDGQPAGTLTGLDNPTGLCSDANGDVWITNADYYGGTLVEYAHGGTSPIATLQDGNYTPDACSVDPGTGNLAVGNLDQNIAIYPNAQGSPTYYSTLGFMGDVRTITYDGSGNLYFRSFRAGNNKAWLPKGGSSVMPFTVKSNGSYQWDGRDLTIRRKGGGIVGRYQLSGSSGKKIGKLQLTGCGYWGNVAIAGATLVSTCGYKVSFYKYPTGGSPTKTISGLTFVYGVTISLGSSSAGIR